MSVTAEATRAIKKELKALYPSLKFSVSMRDYSVVNVILKEGDIDFKEYKTKEGEKYYEDDTRDYFNVNDFHIDSHWNGLARKLFKDILQIIYKYCGTNYDRNAGDLSADYPNWNYFIKASVGSWGEPYVKRG